MADQNQRPHPLYARTVAVVLPVLYDLTWAKDVHVMLGMCGYHLSSWHQVSCSAVMEALAEQLVADIGGDGELTHAAVAQAAALTHTRYAFTLADWPAPASPAAPAAPVAPPVKAARDADNILDDTGALDFDRALATKRRNWKPVAYKPTAAGLAYASTALTGEGNDQ